MGKILQNDGFSEQAEIYGSIVNDNYVDVSFRPASSEDFLFIESLEQYKPYAVAHACGLIVRNLQEKEIIELVRNIRISARPDVYLKPIFLQSAALYEKLKHQVDGLYNPNQVQLLKELAKSINGRIDKLPKLGVEPDFRTMVIFKTLQYLFTRKKSKLKPYRTRASGVGYSLPFISSMLHANENIRMFQMLDVAAAEGLLERNIIDKVNLCKDCSHSYLNFREVCPKCHTLDLTVEPLVHHFRCAHVAPESDFKHGYDLSCPKCDKELRHIGIDYDKPSEIVLCNACNHHTQNPLMEASCVDCGSIMNLEKIELLEICEYTLNPKGEQLAQYGTATTSSEPTTKQEFLKPEVFRLLVEQEWKKMKAKGHESFLFKCALYKAPIAFLSPPDQRKLALECLAITQKYFRDFDLFSFTVDEKIWILMSEATTQEAEAMQILVKGNLDKLIQDNFETKASYIDVTFCPVQIPLPSNFAIVAF